MGVSGGADSVALLTLLRSRPDLSLHVVHLNHETRGDESDEDARFVAQLAVQLSIPCTIDKRSSLESIVPKLPSNVSARYRRLRQELFGRIVQQHNLQGVLLAHHADDQAETILHRLLRGSGFSGLAGMSPSTIIGELRCSRPLLGVRRENLRKWLRDGNHRWREDASNQSPRYLRNRLRMLLADDPALSEALLELGAASADLRAWVSSVARPIKGSLAVTMMADLPQILARATARNWLIASGVPRGKVEPEAIERLLAVCADASTPARSQFPCGVIVARRRGMIQAINKPEIRKPKSEANPKFQLPNS